MTKLRLCGDCANMEQLAITSDWHTCKAIPCMLTQPDRLRGFCPSWELTAQEEKK